MDPITLSALAIGLWASKKYGKKLGGSTEPCHEGPIPHTDKYRWLAVPRSRAHEFPVSDTVTPMVTFLGYLKQVAIEHPRQSTQATQSILCLCQVESQFPGHTILVVKVA